MRKIMITAMMVAVMALMSASPALAVSAISNSYSKSRTYFYTGTTGSFKTTTNYNHIGGLPTNPYTSDFYTELNADHFNKPVVTGWAGQPRTPSFSYRSSGVKTGGRPAYYYNSGTFWVWQPLTTTLSFNATAHSASAGWKQSGHGQYNIPYVSYGPSAYINTYHY